MGVKLAVNIMQGGYGHLQSPVHESSYWANLQTLAFSVVDIRMMGALMRVLTVQAGIQKFMETVQRHIYIYISNTASSAMDITVRDRCTANFQMFYGTSFLEESGNSHTLVIILARRGKWKMLVSTYRQYKLSNTILTTWHFCLQANAWYESMLDAICLQYNFV